MCKRIDRVYRLHDLYLCQVHRSISVHVCYPHIQPIVAGSECLCKHLACLTSGICNLLQCLILMISNTPDNLLVKGQLHGHRIPCYKHFIKCTEAGDKPVIHCCKLFDLLRLLLYLHVYQLHRPVSAQAGKPNSQAVVSRGNGSCKGFSGPGSFHPGPIRLMVIHVSLHILVKGQRNLGWFSCLILIVISTEAGFPSAPFTAEHLDRPAHLVKSPWLCIYYGKIREFTAGKCNGITVSIQIL